MSATEDYTVIVAVRNPRNTINTTSLFDVTTVETERSPYDQFLANSLQLNLHWTRLQPDEEISTDLGNLLLLGYVSAIEGYMRALIRSLINIDPYSKRKCESLQVPYGAVLHHASDALSDALLEETVFSSGLSIQQALTKFIGFENLSSTTKGLTDQYDAICQLRHCCVHRFGKLGAKNATALGLPLHAPYLGKKISLRKTNIADIADLLFALVKSINNEVFGFALKRSATVELGKENTIGIGWKWNVRSDRRRFQMYYSIFASEDDATPSPPPEELYEKFRATYKKVGTRRG